MKFPWNKPKPKTTAELQSEVVNAVVERVMAVTQPQNTLMPAEPPSKGGRPYALDEPWKYWIVQNPKRLPGKMVDVVTLRGMADGYDILRSCIEHLKDSVAATPLSVVPRDPKSGQELHKDVALAEWWISEEGPLGGAGTRRVHFEREMIEDVLVVGASAVWFKLARNKSILECRNLDASTIKPRVDAMGWPDESVPFEQYIMGVQIAGFRPGELRYDGLNPRSQSPYFVSPIEWLISTVTAAIYADEWNRDWLTAGNVRKSDVFTLPEGWTPEQIHSFREVWNALVSGAATERQGTLFLPSGSEKVSDFSRHDQDFQDFEQWLMRRTCAIMGVAPEAIGFSTETYKASQEGAIESERRVGVGRLLEFRKAFYDALFARIGLGHLEVLDQNFTPPEMESRARRMNLETGVPVKTVNESRAEMGLDPVDGGDMIYVEGGYVPLNEVAKQAETTTEAMEAQVHSTTVQTALDVDAAQQAKEEPAQSEPKVKRGSPTLLSHLKTELELIGLGGTKFAAYLQALGKMGHVATNSHVTAVVGHLRAKMQGKHLGFSDIHEALSKHGAEAMREHHKQMAELMERDQ